MKLSGILFASLLMLTSASAAEIDFSKVVRDLDGNGVVKCDRDLPICKEEVTLGFVAMKSLLAEPRTGDADVAGEEKQRRFIMATKLHVGGKIELTAEEIAQLKVVVEHNNSTLIQGLVKLMLDPPAKPVETKVKTKPAETK